MEFTDVYRKVLKKLVDICDDDDWPEIIRDTIRQRVARAFPPGSKSDDIDEMSIDVITELEHDRAIKPIPHTSRTRDGETTVLAFNILPDRVRELHRQNSSSEILQVRIVDGVVPMTSQVADETRPKAEGASAVSGSSNAKREEEEAARQTIPKSSPSIKLKFWAVGWYEKGWKLFQLSARTKTRDNPYGKWIERGLVLPGLTFLLRLATSRRTNVR